jgi:multicomponent Na+:H+ antiporter subunit E
LGRRPVGHAVGLVLGLAAVWLLLSGHFEVLFLFFAVLSIALVVLISIRMDLIDHESVPLHLTLAAPAYWVWLGKEIVKANIDVARRVVDPKLPISPKLFETKASQRTDLGQVIYANSITLTPGTVSVDLDPGIIRVHALSAEGAAEVQAGEMDRRVSRLEGV